MTAEWRIYGNPRLFAAAPEMYELLKICAKTKNQATMSLLFLT